MSKVSSGVNFLLQTSGRVLHLSKFCIDNPAFPTFFLCVPSFIMHLFTSKADVTDVKVYLKWIGRKKQWCKWATIIPIALVFFKWKLGYFDSGLLTGRPSSWSDIAYDVASGVCVSWAFYQGAQENEKVSFKRCGVMNFGKVKNLEEVPDEIIALKGVKQLDFSSNPSLFQVTKKIGNLTELTHLDLSDCNISELPDGMKNLTKLTHLDLSGNQSWTSVPEWMYQLNQNCVVNMCDTGLSEEERQKVTARQSIGTYQGPRFMGVWTIAECLEHFNTFPGNNMVAASFDFLSSGNESNSPLKLQLMLWLNRICARLDSNALSNARKAALLGHVVIALKGAQDHQPVLIDFLEKRSLSRKNPLPTSPRLAHFDKETDKDYQAQFLQISVMFLQDSIINPELPSF